jgi:hypothetical protein
MRQLLTYWPPIVAVVDVAHGGGHTAFGHHGMGFAEE